MQGLFQIAGPNRTVELFGVRLVGVNAENGKKLLLTLAFVAAVILINRLLKLVLRAAAGEKQGRIQFWTRQAIRLVSAMALVIGIVSIWLNNPSQLASAAAFVTAGLAIASQRLITALAGYLIILRGKNFNVGDRIAMGGVRGDVVALGFMQTTIMEMGQPPGEQADEPSIWVSARQYTGRIVTVTNDKIFDNPVYNYTTEFPYLWEEMRVPIPYGADRDRAERVLLEAARSHTQELKELGNEAVAELERRYMIQRDDFEPRVYYRLTDNWCEMAVRFIVEARRVRSVKDRMSRDILTGFDAAGIQVASATFEIVGLPELRVRLAPPQ